MLTRRAGTKSNCDHEGADQIRLAYTILAVPARKRGEGKSGYFGDERYRAPAHPALAGLQYRPETKVTAHKMEPKKRGGDSPRVCMWTGQARPLEGSVRF